MTWLCVALTDNGWIRKDLHITEYTSWVRGPHCVQWTLIKSAHVHGWPAVFLLPPISLQMIRHLYLGQVAIVQIELVHQDNP